MDNIDEEKRINIETLPDNENKEEKRQRGRPKLSPSKRKNVEKTNDKYTSTDNRKTNL